MTAPTIAYAAIPSSSVAPLVITATPTTRTVADHGDDLLDTLLARANAGDMLADARAAVGAYAAALDDQVGIALGAFDFGSQRHRSYDEDATSYGIRWQVALCSRIRRC